MMVLITLRSVKQYFGVCCRSGLLRAIHCRPRKYRPAARAIPEATGGMGVEATLRCTDGVAVSLSTAGRRTPPDAGERAWVVCVLDLSSLDLFYGQRTHANAIVIKVPEAQCGNGVRGGAAARGFVWFLGWGFGIGLSDLIFSKSYLQSPGGGRVSRPTRGQVFARPSVHNYRRSLVSVARFAPGYSLGFQAAWQRVGGATALRRVGVAPRGIGTGYGKRLV